MGRDGRRRCGGESGKGRFGAASAYCGVLACLVAAAAAAAACSASHRLEASPGSGLPSLAAAAAQAACSATGSHRLKACPGSSLPSADHNAHRHWSGRRSAPQKLLEGTDSELAVGLRCQGSEHTCPTVCPGDNRFRSSFIQLHCPRGALQCTMSPGPGEPCQRPLRIRVRGST